MWTHFWDMHSGGSQKEKWSQIFIEAPEEQAKKVFCNRFGHNPDRVTCTCCGPDYSIQDYVTLEEATSYHRQNKSVEEFSKEPDILIIYAKDIKPEELEGELPTQGYIWQD